MNNNKIQYEKVAIGFDWGTILAGIVAAFTFSARVEEDAVVRDDGSGN